MIKGTIVVQKQDGSHYLFMQLRAYPIAEFKLETLVVAVF